MKCPNKNSKEYKDLLAKYNGNEQKADVEYIKLYMSDTQDDYDFFSGLDSPISDFSDEEFEEMSEDEYEELKDDVADDSGDFSGAIDKVKIWIANRVDTIKKQKIKNKDEASKRRDNLNRYNEIRRELDAVKSINLFINEAFTQIKGQHAELMKVLSTKDDATVDKRKILVTLYDAYEEIMSYNILDEISQADINNYFSGNIGNKDEKDYTPQDKITKALELKKKIETLFETEVPALLANTLMNYKNTEGFKKVDEQIEKFNKQIEEIKKDESLSLDTRVKFIQDKTKELVKWQNLKKDEEQLTKMLKQAITDESYFDYLVSPLISSTDSTIALFATMVKNKLESTKIDDVDERDEIVDKLQEFMSKTGRGLNNVGKLYEGIYEVASAVKMDEYNKKVRNDDGELQFVERMSFVDKYDRKKYEQALDKVQQTKPKRTEEETDAQYKKRYNKWKNSVLYPWLNKNNKPKSAEEIAKVKAEMRKKLITDEDYEKWERSTIIIDSIGNKIFTRELAEPIDEYLNPKWLEIYNKDGSPKNAVGEFHKYLIEKYLKGQELLPESQRLGLILPSVAMQAWERANRKGVVSSVKTGIQDMTVITNRDQNIYGVDVTDAKSRKEAEAKLTEAQKQEILDNLAKKDDPSKYTGPQGYGDDKRLLPVYYTQYMSPDDVSVDLASSLLLHNSSARRYDALNDINAEINSFKIIINKRKPPVLNSKGEAMLNSVAKRLGFEDYLRQNGMSNSARHVNDFIDMVVMGQSQASEKAFGIEVSKLANMGMGFASITTIAGDFMKGLANNLQGNIQFMIESAGAEYFSVKNWAKGKAKYYSKVSGVISDFTKLKPESWLGKLCEMYDPLQGTFKDEYGRNVSASMANKLIRTSTLFWNQNFAEHEIQVSTMLAFFDAIKVIDKETDKEITLLEAHEKYGAKLYDKEGKSKIKITSFDQEGNSKVVDYTDAERQKVMNKLHALNKRMHGVYNEFDKSTAQKHAIGRLLFMYRKHLVPGFKRRWKDASYDEELGNPTEGMYRVFYRTMLKDLKVYKLNISKRWATMTPFEKAQVKKVLAEAAIVIAFTALIIALTAMGGDDDDKKEMPAIYYHMMYQAIRMRAETWSYAPFIPSAAADLYRSIKSPSAVLGFTQRLIKFTNQFLLVWDEEKLVYKRDTGIWNKGDNKSWAYFLKLMGLSGYNLNPQEAVKTYQSLSII